MARAVNREIRRRELAEALLRITADRGLDQVSIREVAAEAGVAIGTVQHYFPTKDELLRFAFEYTAEQVRERVDRLDHRGTVGQVLRRFLAQLLPLDQQRDVEARIYLAFAARAAVVPYLAEVQRNTYAGVRTALKEAIAYAITIGETPTSVDPEVEAEVLIAVVDGLLLHVLTEPGGLSPQAAEAALDAYMGRIFDLGPSEPSRHAEP
ncbi:MAG: TetR/AcrR family transcriptional regulator [Egibacteraceae bacterium]